MIPAKGDAPIPSKIVLSSHAVERFQERLRPALTVYAARRELERLRDFGEVVAEAPSWVGSEQAVPGWFLAVGDGVVLPLEAHRDRPDCWVTVTCLTRGSISPLTRSSRNRRRRRRPNLRDGKTHRHPRPAAPWDPRTDQAG